MFIRNEKGKLIFDSEYVTHRFLKYRMWQRPEIFMVLNHIFLREKFSRIIEIGTSQGGLSLYLSFCCFVKDIEFYTFDINEPPVTDKIKYMKGNFFKLDVFSEKGILTIEKLIKKSGRVMVLCDGGNKKREFRLFSGMLKKNDVIMAHDYFKNKSLHKNQSPLRWRSCEIVENDIEDSVKKYNLKDFYSKNFEDVFWVSKVKG